MDSLKAKILTIFESRNLNELESKNIPHPSTMSGVAEGSKIIVSAILENKRIAIIGDYDVDGVASSCIMEAFFKQIGYQNFIIKIPNRFADGYGISARMVRIYNADIFITVDNGITAFEVGEYCTKNGKTLIITDHHKPLIENNAEILPKARVIINPNQRKCNFLQKDICGAVVAWYLCAGIKIECEKRGILCAKSVDLLEFTPFLALAIISDIMPLTSLNRTLYKLGLKRINTAKKGVFALLREEFGERFKANSENGGAKIIDSQSLAFYIAPLLNSAGRVKNARLAFKFLRAKDFKNARILLDLLKATNTTRKAIQCETFEIAKANAFESPHFVFAFGNALNEGVVGIVAAKLVESFNKSAFCFSLKNGVLKGSGRAFGNVNLIATIQNCAEFLKHFGGHSGAVGLSLDFENLSAFQNEIEKSLKFYEKSAESSVIYADLREINMEILEILESFEPYGNGNERLIFTSNAIVSHSKIIKETHQKLRFKDSNLNAILFNNTQDFVGQSVQITYQIKRGFFGEAEATISEIKQI